MFESLTNDRYQVCSLLRRETHQYRFLRKMNERNHDSKTSEKLIDRKDQEKGVRKNFVVFIGIDVHH